MKKLVIAIALGLLVSPLAANAAGEHRYNLKYPGTFCSNPGGLLPNGAVGIGNWTGGQKGVSCPIIAETDVYTVMGHASVTATSGVNVSACTLRVVQTSINGQSEWIYWPNNTAVSNGIATAGWPGVGLPSSSATALECNLPHNQTLWHYSARTDYTNQL